MDEIKESELSKRTIIYAFGSYDCFEKQNTIHDFHQYYPHMQSLTFLLSTPVVGITSKRVCMGEYEPVSGIDRTEISLISRVLLDDIFSLSADKFKISAEKIKL